MKTDAIARSAHGPKLTINGSESGGNTTTLYQMRRTWTDSGRRPSHPCYRVRSLLACQTIATQGLTEPLSLAKVSSRTAHVLASKRIKLDYSSEPLH
jgi:hypothetical protein